MVFYAKKHLKLDPPLSESVWGGFLLKIQILHEKPQGSTENRPRELRSAGTKRNQGYAPRGTKWNRAAASPDGCKTCEFVTGRVSEPSGTKCGTKLSAGTKRNQAEPSPDACKTQEFVACRVSKPSGTKCGTKPECMLNVLVCMMWPSWNQVGTKRNQARNQVKCQEALHGLQGSGGRPTF